MKDLNANHLNSLNFQQEMELYNLHMNMNYVIPFITEHDIMSQQGYIQSPFNTPQEYMCHAFSCYNCERAVLHAMPEHSDWKKKAQASSIVYETSPKTNIGANGFTIDTLQRLRMVPESDKTKPFYVYDEKLGRKRRHDPWFANHNPSQKLGNKYSKKPETKNSNSKNGLPYNSKNPNGKNGRKKNYGSPSFSNPNSPSPMILNSNENINTNPIVKLENSALGDIYLLEDPTLVMIKQERPTPGSVHCTFNPQQEKEDLDKEERDLLRTFNQNLMNFIPLGIPENNPQELLQARIPTCTDSDIFRTNAAITNTTVSEYVNILGNDDFDWAHHLLTE